MSLVGTKVRNLKILEVVGKGGMGEVYVAFDETLERKVALKVILEGRRLGASARARFVREARILSRLDHPNVCRVHDYIDEGDRDYLVLEWIEGVNLQEVSKDTLDHAARMKIALQIAEALSAAHNEGVLHRDLKPGNVMLTEQGDVKVLDFGLARSTGPAEEASGETRAAEGSDPDATAAPDPEETATMLGTMAGSVVGTPRYMSPEQGRGEPLALASDMYSYGLLLQHLFTGEDPYGGIESFDELMDRVRVGRTTPVAGIDPDLARLIERLKDASPARRPTAVETIERLRWIVDKPRRRLRRLAVAAAAVLLIAAGVKYTVDLRRERAEADRRRGQAEELIGFMLGDLRDKLSPIGRLDVLDDVGDRALAYFATLPEEQLTEEERFRLAQAMWQIGEVRIDQGNADEALSAFVDSRSRIQALLETHPDHPPWLMGLGTAHFWVGSVHFYKGDLDAAEAEFVEYMNVAQRLVDMRPDDESMLELGYAHTNLAALYEERGDIESAQRSLRASIDIKRRLVDSGPADPERVTSLANSLEWLAVTQTSVGDLAGTLETQRAAFELRRRLADRDPNDAKVALQFSVAHNLLGVTLEHLGQDDESLAHKREDLKICRRLVDHDPENAWWKRSLAMAILGLGRFRLTHGEPEEALLEIERALHIVEELHELDPSHQEWRTDVTAARQVRAMALLRLNGRAGEAGRVARTVVGDWRELVVESPHDTFARTQLSRALMILGEASRAAGRDSDAQTHWTEALQLLESEMRDPEVLDVKARLLVLSRRTDDARRVVAELLGKGYRRTDFLEFLSTHGVES